MRTNGLFGNRHPMFVMSMYGSKEELYKAKAEYYMGECDRLDKSLAEKKEQLQIDTLNPNRRAHINELLEQIDELTPPEGTVTLHVTPEELEHITLAIVAQRSTLANTEGFLTEGGELEGKRLYDELGSVLETVTGHIDDES